MIAVGFPYLTVVCISALCSNHFDICHLNFDDHMDLKRKISTRHTINYKILNVIDCHRIKIRFRNRIYLKQYGIP